MKKREKKNKKQKDQEKELLESPVDATDFDREEEKKDIKEKTSDKKIKFLDLWAKFSVYKFIFYSVIAVLLIILGILVLVNKDESIFAIYIFTAGITIIADIIRLIVTIKLNNNGEIEKNVSKVIFIELLLEFIMGIIFVLAAINVLTVKYGDDPSKFSIDMNNFFNNQYVVLISIIFYIACLCYFIRTILLNVKSNKTIFTVMMVMFTGSLVLLAFREKLTAWAVAVIIAVISFICALYSIIDAGGGFYIYQKSKKPKEDKEEKKEEENKEEPSIFPSLDEEKEQNDNEELTN